jgi:16S rRNA (guanine1207-N2)-methyltransferase
LGATLDDKAYTDLRLIESDELSFYSKPGVFGWQKIDKGSEFLIEQLAMIDDGSGLQGQSVLDLGCGYGYLSLKAGALRGSRITAVDNNIAAVTACRKNLQHVGLDAEVVCDDCGSSLAGNFDLILCNPPFHQGFDMESELTSKFIGASYQLLKPGGKALFVVNAFIPLERKAVDFYDKVDVIANNKSFKVLLLSR